mmetsp:Transcript_8251/g.12413  ORF Transcript_8251/g.12413 Transcript_8251/m.12413 type:complete len:179 (+) Transcript_8251:5474-6010(+)
MVTFSVHERSTCVPVLDAPVPPLMPAVPDQKGRFDFSAKGFRQPRVIAAQGEFRLARTLQQLAQGERQIEVSNFSFFFSISSFVVKVVRQMLVEEPGYDPFGLFSVMDVDAKGYVSRSALRSFLRKHHIYAFLQMRRYAKSAGTLKFSEFLQSMEPIGSPIPKRKKESILSPSAGIQM